MSISLEALFWDVDDFCKVFEPKWHQSLISRGLQQRQRCLRLSEIMTILISFHQNHFRNFKHFYPDHVCKDWRDAFPGRPSYFRFVEFAGSALLPLCVYLKHCFGQCTGISFIDATCLRVCHNRRIHQHRVFVDRLKNISQIEHSRHRSPIHATIDVICGLIAYCHQPKKPALMMEWTFPSAA